MWDFYFLNKKKKNKEFNHFNVRLLMGGKRRYGSNLEQTL